MTKISQYALDSSITDDDKILGSDGVEGINNGVTKNFSVGKLKEYILADVEPGSVVVDSNTVYSTTVTITPTQMLSLNGGGAIELLPTPDTGKGYLLTDTFTKIEHNTIAYNFLYSPAIAYYDTETSSAPFYSYWGSLERIVLNDLYIGANLEDTFSRNVPPASTNPIIVRQLPVYLYSSSSETVTQGDATIKITLEYRIIDIP
jgi:hypothetical protein